MSIWKYGSYSHPESEINVANITVRNIHSGRGRLRNVLFTYHLRGEICATTTAEITSRIAEIEAAYSVEGRDFGLYLDTNTPTAHTLSNSHPNNLSGNRILQRPSFPVGGPTEYATGRTFDIIVQALFASPEAQILEYHETIRYIGTGGPSVYVRNMLKGPPKLYLQCQRTAQRIVQSGRSIGFNGYVEPSGPIFPSYEHVDERMVEYGTPQFHGQQATEWPMQWAYYMSSPVSAIVPPIPR